MCKAKKQPNRQSAVALKTARSLESKDKLSGTAKPKLAEPKKAATSVDEVNIDVVNVDTQTEVTDATKTVGEEKQEWLGPKNFQNAAAKPQQTKTKSANNSAEKDAPAQPIIDTKIKLTMKGQTKSPGKNDEVFMGEESIKRQKLIDKKAAEGVGKEANANTNLDSHAPVTINKKTGQSKEKRKSVNQPPSTLPTNTPTQFMLRPARESKEKTQDKEPTIEKENNENPINQQKVPDEQYEPIMIKSIFL